MKKTNADRLVGRYLRGLRAELRDLPADRRREIFSQFQEHIAEHRLEAGSDREEDVRAMLDRLGDPAVIGAEARDRFGVRRRGRGPLVIALVFIGLAPVLLVGPAMVFGGGPVVVLMGLIPFAVAVVYLAVRMRRLGGAPAPTV